MLNVKPTVMSYIQFLYCHGSVLLEGQINKQLQFRTNHDQVFALKSQVLWKTPGIIFKTYVSPQSSIHLRLR